jgi:hypothetical protein
MGHRMIKNYSIQYLDGITIIYFPKTPTIDKAKEVIDQIARKNAYHLRLWDFSDVQFNFTVAEIKW